MFKSKDFRVFYFFWMYFRRELKVIIGLKFTCLDYLQISTFKSVKVSLNRIFATCI